MSNAEGVERHVSAFVNAYAETGAVEEAVWAAVQEERRRASVVQWGRRAFDPRADRVIGWVCDYYSIGLSRLLTKDRHPFYVRARWVAMRALRNAALSLPIIGLHLGRTHVTVMAGLARIANEPDLLAVAARAQVAL